MRFLYTLFIAHVHLLVNNNFVHCQNTDIICYDFNNKLATLGIQYNVCTAAAVCACVCGGAGAHSQYILQCQLKNIYNDQIHSQTSLWFHM